MKVFILPGKKIWFLILCLGIIFSCRKNETVNNPVPPANSSEADSVSDHFQFYNAVKKQGAIPKGPSASSLKISFKDTLYLTDQVSRPVRFLHTDTTQNVAGAYIQVLIGSAGGPLGATYYYDVPEVPDMADNDTVSVIMIGFDPKNIQQPFTFEIKIIPYDKNRQPLLQSIRPVKVVKHTTDPKGNATSCGLVLPPGEYWDWELSMIPTRGANSFDFWNEPSKSFGAGGQDIKGSCCAGISVYGICPGTREPNASLHFATYYRISMEQLTFYDGGTFLRQTFEESPIPLPDSSDFCAGGDGRVRYNLNHTVYNGNYSVTPATLPPDLQVYKNDSLLLRLDQTSSSGLGYGNPGGIIHQLDCEMGSLVLIQLDLEGFGQHLYKFYTRREPRDPIWWSYLGY